MNQRFFEARAPRNRAPHATEWDRSEGVADRRDLTIVLILNPMIFKNDALWFEIVNKLVINQCSFSAT